MFLFLYLFAQIGRYALIEQKVEFNLENFFEITPASILAKNVFRSQRELEGAHVPSKESTFWSKKIEKLSEKIELLSEKIEKLV